MRVILLAPVFCSGAAFGAGHDHHPEQRRSGRRLQRPDGRRPGWRKHGDDSRPAAAHRLPGRRGQVGRNADERVTIVIRAQWTALTCTSTGAVLGQRRRPWRSSGLFRRARGGPLVQQGARQQAVWSRPRRHDARHQCELHVNLANPACLDGVFFTSAWTTTTARTSNLVTVLEHGVAHGLASRPSRTVRRQPTRIRSRRSGTTFSCDTTTSKTWTLMTAPERQASALQYAEAGLTGGERQPPAVPAVPKAGTPLLTVTAPAGVAGAYSVGTASFGPPLSSPARNRPRSCRSSTHGAEPRPRLLGPSRP